MGRLEKELDPGAGPLAQLACDLRELRRGAGSPTYRAMSSVAKYSPSALSAAAGGAILPSEGVLVAYVRACGGDVDEWRLRRARIASSLVATRAAGADADPGAPTDDADAPADVSHPHQHPHQHQHPRTVRLDGRPHRLRRRAAGLVAAMMLGSIATIVPMAIWGAPTCLGDGHGRPIPAANCPMAPAAMTPLRPTR